MQLTITETAHQWFEESYPLEEGESIRFFGKLYGKTDVHDGFSVGMKIDNPAEHDLLAKLEENGRTYFASKDDDWFFARYDLEVDFDTEHEAPIYNFTERETDA